MTAYFDLTGITVDPFKSDGIPRYGQFANGSISRHNSDWASFSVAHVEFDPVSNMARYGWQQFLQTGNARGLGWVLHAIGDAACPQHVLGSLGWGHQPWERFADVQWVDTRVFPEAAVQTQYSNMVTELTYAFQYWTFANQSPPADWVGPLIGQLVSDTAALPASSEGRIFQAGVSLSWALGSDSDQDAINTYDGETPALKELLMRAVGASVAFLVKGSTSAPNVATPTPCGCSGAMARSAEDANGALIPSPAGVCVACGTGAFAAEPLLLDGRCVTACPRDKPTVSAGICASTNACPVNAPFMLNGLCAAACCIFDASCPAATPIRQNGACVSLAQCNFPYVVDNRICATACPAGQTPDPATNYCKRPATHSSSCSSDSALCEVDGDCCSGSCRQADGICRLAKGAPCVVNDDCRSQACRGGVCAGSPGEVCQTDTKCSIACLANKCCSGELGGCTADLDCCGSALCSPQGQCVTPTCTALNQSCVTNTDCCSNFCQDVENGAGPLCATNPVIP